MKTVILFLSLLIFGRAQGQYTLGPVSTTPISAYSAGTVYTLTATSAAVAFGTTSPAITITTPGTWLIMARANVFYNAATFAATRTLTLKLRRTNNSAGDLTNGSTAQTVAVITTSTYTEGINHWVVVYTTTNTDDAVTIFGDISVVPTAGSIQVSEASIVATRLY